MTMLAVNLDTSDLLNAPGTTAIGTSGVDTVGTQFWYAITSRTNTVNGTEEICGQSLISTILDGTKHDGSTNTLSWSLTGADDYIVYKGTADGDGTYLYSYATVDGAVGTWDDPTITTIFNSSIGTPENNMAYTVGVNLPTPTTYSASFKKNKINHRTINNALQVYNRGNVYNSTTSFDHLLDNQRDDFEIVYNWNANIRLFPVADYKPSIFFNVIWNSDWDFTLTSPQLIQGGWTGQIQWLGIENISDASDVV